jgi:hypothetical protein
LKFVTACLCQHCWIWTKFPDCLLQLKSSTECICCECENACKLKMPKTCVKSRSQNCCLDCRCALPCDDEVPLACAICGIVLLGKSKMGSAHWSGGPETQTMGGPETEAMV